MTRYSGGVRHDYKDSSPDARAFDPRGLSFFAIGLILPLIAVVLMLVSEPNESMVPDRAAIAPEDRIELALLEGAGDMVALSLPPLAAGPASGLETRQPGELERNAMLGRGEALTLVVQRNDSLDRLFRRNDLSIADLDAMVDLPDASRPLSRIRPGDEIEVIRDGRDILSLRKELSESQELWIHRDETGFIAEFLDLEVEIRSAGAHGVIDSSLFEAAADAGVSDGVILQMAGIFQWDIDFFLDVREDDSFTVVYEEIWRDGRKLRDGRIIAAEYINRGDIYRAAHYVDASGGDGYFTPEGMSVRRPFLRNPIEFSRISSSFNPTRRHPILNTIRAHRGVDLAAPTGTEIRAVADGKIIARGANGSFGNRVEIQHGGNVTTLYAHMSRFGNFRVGDRVRQNDIVGYVGMTGGATGPHLHYEYRLNGVHQNPRTVELPDAEPIEDAFLADFRETTASVWRQLDLYQQTLLANNTD